MLFINGSIAEIFEYDDVIFYPNGSQTINISKLYIDINDRNMIQTCVIYKNRTFLFPQLLKNETVDLPIEKLNISVKISAIKVSKNEWNIYYTVKNNYNYGIPINISFPNGYNLNNVSTVVSSRSSKTVILSKSSSSDTLYFGESNMSFAIPSKIKIKYSSSIPFSIEKSNKVLNNGSILWNANYSIHNTKNISLKLNGTVWAVVGNEKINLGNFSNIILNPNSTFKLSRKIYTNSVPTFYIDYYNWNETYKNIEIKPALKRNNSYIIGISLVKGGQFTYHYHTSYHHHTSSDSNPNTILPETDSTEKNNNNNNNGKNGGSGAHKGTSNSRNSKKEPSTASKVENTIKEKLREYKILPYSESGEVMGIKIKKLKNPKDAVVLTIPLSVLSLLFAPLLLLENSPDVLDGGYIDPKLYNMSRRKVYIPYGVKLGNVLPLNITLVSPNSQLVSEIYESFDIPLNSAKALAISIEYGGRLITSDKRTCEIAVNIGVNAIYMG